MINWIKRIIGGTEDRLKSASDEQACRLEKDETERKLRELKDRLQHQQATEEAKIANAVKTRLEAVFTDAAVPVSQLLTQDYLIEVERKPVQVSNVMAVAKRIVGSFEDAGMRVEGEVGGVMAFDPNLHQPLSSELSISTGQAVVIRFVGISYQGKIIRKAGVERVKE